MVELERRLMYNAYIIHQNEWRPAVCQRRQSQTQAVPPGASFIPPLITLYWSNTDGGGMKDGVKEKKRKTWKDRSEEREKWVLCVVFRLRGRKRDYLLLLQYIVYTAQYANYIWPTTFAKMLTTWNNVSHNAKCLTWTTTVWWINLK